MSGIVYETNWWWFKETFWSQHISVDCLSVYDLLRPAVQLYHLIRDKGILKIPESLQGALCIIREQSIKCRHMRVKRITEEQ